MHVVHFSSLEKCDTYHRNMEEKEPVSEGFFFFSKAKKRGIAQIPLVLDLFWAKIRAG